MSIIEGNWDKIKLIDLHEASEVEFIVDQHDKVWLNIEGKCAVRIGKANRVTIKDRR